MDLIPVIDLKGGRVVRGVAGHRHHYQPNSSWLSPSADAVETLRALQRAFAPPMLYAADLDGLEAGRPQWDLLKAMSAEGPLAVDAGVTSATAAKDLLACGVARVIVPLESLSHWSALREIVDSIGRERIMFSLDLRDGRPLGPLGDGRQPLEIVREAEQAGVWQLIVLDLAHVGVGRGVPTKALCQAIRRQHPELLIWTGGGVRNIADLHALAVTHVDGALVASALHDGHITPEDWSGLHGLDDIRIQQATDA